MVGRYAAATLTPDPPTSWFADWKRKTNVEWLKTPTGLRRDYHPPHLWGSAGSQIWKNVTCFLSFVIFILPSLLFLLYLLAPCLRMTSWEKWKERGKKSQIWKAAFLVSRLSSPFFVFLSLRWTLDENISIPLSKMADLSNCVLVFVREGNPKQDRVSRVRISQLEVFFMYKYI